MLSYESYFTSGFCMDPLFNFIPSSAWLRFYPMLFFFFFNLFINKMIYDKVCEYEMNLQSLHGLHIQFTCLLKLCFFFFFLLTFVHAQNTYMQPIYAHHDLDIPDPRAVS